MRKIFLIAILCLVPFIGQAQELQAPFAHPGLNHSRADLERMKEKVLAKEKPWIYNRENETSIFSKRNEQKLHFFAPISLPQKHRLNAN